MLRITRDGKTISPSARLVTTWLGQFRGLMFSRQRDLVFDLKREKRVWMHMMFVFYPIDVILLDSRRTVVGLRPVFRPFHWYLPGIEARFILELSRGAIGHLGIRRGDRLEF